MKSRNALLIQPNEQSLRADVEALCAIQPARAFHHPASLEKAADYIRGQWESMGFSVTDQPYEVQGRIVRNLVTSIGPEDAPVLVVGAHYDVCGDQPGADDNASGIAGLLELSRLLAEMKPDLKYRVELVAYTLEEPPFFATNMMGSAVHAKDLRDSNREVRGMICLEMIGYFSDEKGSQDYPVGLLKWFYPTRGNFIAVVGKLGKGKLTRQVKRLMKKGSDIPVESINAPAALPGIDFSDHRNYWAVDYPAVMITNTAFYRNKSYHEVTDTPDRLDYERMGKVVAGVYNAVVNLN